MAREDLHFRLRIPEDLKQKIQDTSEINRRSMTAEIIDRLERSFNEEREDTDDNGENGSDVYVHIGSDSVPVSMNEAVAHLSEIARRAGVEVVSITCVIQAKEDLRTVSEREDDYFKIIDKYRATRDLDTVDKTTPNDESTNG